MSVENRIPKGRGGVCPVALRRCAGRERNAVRSVQLFGWDSRNASWHGPNQLTVTLRGSLRLLEALRSTPGTSWYGRVNCCTPRQSGGRLFAVVHDLGDCALATLYCDESRTGPVEILAALPAEHRAKLRPEFAFEFVAFGRFLGAISPGSELALHDLIAAGIAQAGASDSLLFSISTGLWISDLDHVLSHCVERVAMGILQWVVERDPLPQAYSLESRQPTISGPARAVLDALAPSGK